MLRERLCAVLVGSAMAGAVSMGAFAVGPAAAVGAATTSTSDRPGSARVLVVAPEGSDANAGTARAPLATIQTAVDRLAARPSGGRVELRGGTYHQRVTLIGVHGITLAPYGSEQPVLDGTGLTPPRGLTALVEIENSTAVTVQGLEITGYWSATLGVVPAGIYIHGHDHAITITGNHVHDLGNSNGTLGSFDINAHGIATYGDDPTGPVSDLTIADNVVDHLKTGASETVVVNGNVDGWTIARNHIYSDNNIGIDAIGYEPTLTGIYRYTRANRARDGLIEGNVISRIRSKGNPAYWQGGSDPTQIWCNCADGIYVDGGTHIRITGNQVSSSDIGIEVAAENPKGQADHVRVDHNHVTGSLYVGITTGGYCNGDRACGGVRTGKSLDNLFDHNVLRDNNGLNDRSPELLVQYYASHDAFVGNTITATNDAHMLMGTVPGGTSHDNRSDDNTFAAYFAPGQSGRSVSFGWSGKVYYSFRAYQAATGQDEHSSLTRVG